MEPTTIEVAYNPFSQSASLLIDGIPFQRPGSKISTFLVGKPFTSWLEPYTKSYQQWEGFLAEIMNEINDERFLLTFAGIQEDYALFCDAIGRQAHRAEDWGFSPECYQLRFEERFSPRQMAEVLRQLRKKVPGPLPTQKLYLMQDALDDRLSSEPAGLEDIWNLTDQFLEFVNALLDEWVSGKKEDCQVLIEIRHQLSDLC